MLHATLLALVTASLATAHTAAWAPGMYCRGGADPTKDDPNTNLVVNPLYQLAQQDWWFQHDRGCDSVPPAPGSFLSLPANGNFTVELAHNRAHTTLSYEGKQVTDWPDGKEHPADWNGWNMDGTPAVCLKEDGAMHTYNQSSAGGTAFAISYHDSIEDVTLENLVVFSTLDHTPWKRVATYEVPDLPACPEGGCTCAWLWVPNGCGQANMYMQGFKCTVTGSSPTARPLGKPQAPVYCANEPEKCVSGPKQMLAWQQAEGNNIVTQDGVTPNYNAKCGWEEGAQTDIFEIDDAEPAVSSPISTLSSAVVVSLDVDVASTTVAASVTRVAVTPTTGEEAVSVSVTAVLNGNANAVSSMTTECTARRARYTGHQHWHTRL